MTSAAGGDREEQQREREAERGQPEAGDPEAPDRDRDEHRAPRPPDAVVQPLKNAAEECARARTADENRPTPAGPTRNTSSATPGTATAATRRPSR